MDLAPPFVEGLTSEAIEAKELSLPSESYLWCAPLQTIEITNGEEVNKEKGEFLDQHNYYFLFHTKISAFSLPECLD